MDVAGRRAAGLGCELGRLSADRTPPFKESFRVHGAEGPDRPAEAAAKPPSEGKGGLKQYSRVSSLRLRLSSEAGGSCVVLS